MFVSRGDSVAYSWSSGSRGGKCEDYSVMEYGIIVGDLWLTYLPLNPRFTGSNLAENDAFLRALKSVARLPSSGK
jgi:hypothetical protein